MSIKSFFNSLFNSEKKAKNVNAAESQSQSEINKADEKTKLKETSSNDEVITSDRFIGRAYGFAWTIMEKRDPNFDGEKLKGQSPGMLILIATGFATKEESDVLLALLKKLETAPKSKNEQMDNMFGGLEGKLIIYNNLDPKLLLENKEIK